MEALVSSFLLIFVAEMGDKTQLLSMAFTTRFKAYQVIAAISAATLLNNLIAVVAGSLLSGALPVSAIKTASCVLFILFGLWTVWGADNENGEKKPDKFIINPFFTVAIMFFISEFGDKTQIAAMTLAMNESPLYVFIGASLGMICANLIGITAGVLVAKKIPPHIIKWCSAILFIVIGFIGFWTVLHSSMALGNAVLLESAIVILTLLIILLREKRKKRK